MAESVAYYARRAPLVGLLGTRFQRYGTDCQSDFAQLAEGASVPAPPDAPPAEVRDQNLETLAPYLEALADCLPLSFFGL